ncbi:hypothetical protein CI610_02954 [invertebrate metagenome]|uniref:Uncharacterized protein n=1 Tax=invertebrate metagenome TaxID=1711999 RepID=A0A2H9T4G0_9ZZZZ
MTTLCVKRPRSTTCSPVDTGDQLRLFIYVMRKTSGLLLEFYLTNISFPIWSSGFGIRTSGLVSTNITLRKFVPRHFRRDCEFYGLSASRFSGSAVLVYITEIQTQSGVRVRYIHIMYNLDLMGFENNLHIFIHMIPPYTEQ